MNPQPPPNADQPAPAPEAEQTPEEEQQERWIGLMEQTNLYGSTGWAHTGYAGSGPAGTFRVSFLTDWFSASNFLCRPGDIAYTSATGTPVTKACTKGSTQSDQTSRVGGTFVINATPLSFLEAYALLRTYATSNDQGSPQLLQVLGDTTLAVKGFIPPKLGRIFTAGGEAQLLLLNGTGGVGVSGAGTSAIFRAMASVDTRLRNDTEVFPFRANVNIGYHLDNSGQLVLAVEEARAKAAGITNPAGSPDPGPARLPITRIERFGLGINQVDSIPIAIGAGLPFQRVQPYVEWSIDIPVNRQNYYCHTGRLSNGDVCLGLGDPGAVNPGSAGGPGIAAIPSRFTLGVKTNPLPQRTWHGLSAHVALDIGTSGVTTFIEEMAPQAPWTLYLGLGFVYDTKEPPVTQGPPPPPVKEMVPRPADVRPRPGARAGSHRRAHRRRDRQLRGRRPGAGRHGPGWSLHHAPPRARHLQVRHQGPSVQAGHVHGRRGLGRSWCASPAGRADPQCPADPVRRGAHAVWRSPDAVWRTAGCGWRSGRSRSSGRGGSAPGGPCGAGGSDVRRRRLPARGAAAHGQRPLVSCVTRRRVGPISGAVVRLTEASGKQVSATTDGGGNFALKDLAPGAVVIRAEAPGYMPHVNPPLDVRASEDARPTIQLAKRPKVASVKIEGKEIKISRQIHFDTDSSKILGDSNALMEEIADVLQRNPGIRKVEIQGHTDNVGTADHNLQLSDARASSVKAWLVGAGIDPARLVPKGYGQTRPLAPNVTAGNRARNRRVQFIILEGK